MVGNRPLRAKFLNQRPLTDIANWIPPLVSFQCIYARAWIQVKHNYELTIDIAEKSAISAILDSC